MKIILFSVIVAISLSGCRKKPRDVCHNPVHEGNEHSFHSCPCIQQIEDKMEKLFLEFAENEQRLGELGLKMLFNNLSESDFDERRSLLQQNKVIIYEFMKQQHLLRIHKDKFHFRVKLAKNHIPLKPYWLSGIFLPILSEQC